MRRALTLLLLALAGCQEEGPARVRPVPTPGPQIVVRDVFSRSGQVLLERGERVRFAVIGTGAGTQFGPDTFLHSAAFEEVDVVAVLSSTHLIAQATVAIGTGDGPKDLAAVSGGEIAVSPWAFEIASGGIEKAGTPPFTRAGEIDPSRDVDLFEFAPDRSAARWMLVRVDRDAEAPEDFAPTLEVFRADGRRVARTDRRCVAVFVNSRASWFARVADPAFGGGEDRRYRLVVGYGEPEGCLTAIPGELVP